MHAGARIIRAIFCKYVASLHAQLVWPRDNAVLHMPGALQAGDPQQAYLTFLQALVAWLEVAVSILTPCKAESVGA